MTLVKRFMPFISTALFVLVFEMWAFRTSWLWYCIAAIVVIYFITIQVLSGHHFWRRQFWNLFIDPGVFAVSAITFFLFIDNQAIQQLFILTVTIGYYLVLHNMYIFLYQTKDYQPYALENIYGYLNFTSFFLLTVSLYGFSILIGWQPWILIAPIFLLVFFLFCRTLRAQKIPWRQHWLTVAMISALVAEAYYAVSFLPTSYLFDGLLVAIVYYLFTNSTRDFLANTADKSTIRKYIYISIIVSVVAFLTTRWF
jgi:hypothetical protein